MEIKELNPDELKTVAGGAEFSGPCFVHIVKQGESLTLIAQKYGCMVEELLKINCIEDPEQIKPGDRLLIPYL